MTANLITILNHYGNSTIQKIRDNLQSTGTNATGKTAQSLRYEIKDNGDLIIMTIYGRPFFATVETGRKATPDYTKPSVEFVASIKQWMIAKGKEGSAYAIAKSIHQKGTKLFRTGGRNDIISSVINQSLVDDISKSVLESYAGLLQVNIKNIYGSNGNIQA